MSHLSLSYVSRFFYPTVPGYLFKIHKNVFQRSRDLRMEDRGKRLLLHRYVNYFFKLSERLYISSFFPCPRFIAQKASRLFQPNTVRTDRRNIDHLQVFDAFFSGLYSKNIIISSVADPRDPVHFWPLEPESGMGKKLRSGYGIWIRDEHPGWYFRELRNYFLC